MIATDSWLTASRVKSAKSSLRKAKLTAEGEAVLQVLISEYQMTREMAVKMMAECGPLFAAAVQQRRKVY